MSELFAAIKGAVTAREAAQRYGLEVRGSWAKCPFHGDRNPSLHFYEKGFKCFSCNAGGSVIDFTAGYLGLTPLEAARKLNEDFSLGIVSGGQPERPRQKSAQERSWDKFALWRKEYLDKLSRAWRTANRIEVGPPDQMGPWEVLSVGWMDTLEETMHTLSNGPLGEQLAIYKDRVFLDPVLDSILTGDMSCLDRLNEMRS